MGKIKIIKQIERLCEKQFRKGFQQGYHACKNNELTQEQVDKFRDNGITENYSKVINLIMEKKKSQLTGFCLKFICLIWKSCVIS